jgi:tetratricopeptide (TPR) repeat protein
MIVRDESEMLPRFFAHAEGLWDELCVVDTGSVDATLALLTATGARVARVPWADDFAAARNASLDLATGDWILFLDADEMISPELVAQVRALLTDDAAGAATVMMKNELPHGHVRVASLLRMFRRDPAIRFRYPIHEDVSVAVRAYLARTGRRLCHLSGEVLHLGYVRARVAARAKKERDRVLLERCIADDPRDYYSRFKLLELGRFWADGGLWRAAARATDAQLRADAPDALATRHFGGELVALMVQALCAGDAKAEAHALDGWEARIEPASAAPLLLRRGQARELCGDVAGARADFLRCLAMTGEPNRQVTTVRPLLGLARLAMVTGAFAEAKERARAALAENPRDPEGLLCALSLARLTGGADQVAALAGELCQAHGDSAELHFAVGDEALLEGDTATAVAELRRAAGTPPTGRIGLRLAQTLLAAGAIDEARALAQALTRDIAEAALGILVCDLAQGKSTALELDLELAEAEAALRTWVDILRVGRAEVLAAVTTNAPAAAELFPWLPAHLARLARS